MVSFRRLTSMNGKRLTPSQGFLGYKKFEAVRNLFLLLQRLENIKEYDLLFSIHVYFKVFRIKVNYLRFWGTHELSVWLRNDV
jgi:hypothetical protein